MKQLRGHFTRRPAMPDDVAQLSQLRHQTMDMHLASSGVAVSEAEHAVRVVHRLECAEVLLSGERIVGLLKVARDAGAWQVLQIQLAPDLQGKAWARH